MISPRDTGGLAATLNSAASERLDILDASGAVTSPQQAAIQRGLWIHGSTLKPVKCRRAWSCS